MHTFGRSLGLNCKGSENMGNAQRMEQLAELYRERAAAGDRFAARCYHLCQLPHLKPIISTKEAAAALHDAIVEFEKEEAKQELLGAVANEANGKKLFQLGAKCYLGKSLQRDIRMAITLWTRAEELGNPDARLALAICGPKDIRLRLNDLIQNVEQDHLPSYVALGVACFQGLPEFPCFWEGAQKLWKHAADRGSVQAKYYLGVFHETLGDHEVAVQLLREAERQGSLPAKSRLGLYHLKGLAGFERDEDVGLMILQQGFRKRDPFAEEYLMECSNQGIGVEQSSAVAWSIQEKQWQWIQMADPVELSSGVDFIDWLQEAVD